MTYIAHICYRICSIGDRLSGYTHQIGREEARVMRALQKVNGKTKWEQKQIAGIDTTARCPQFWTYTLDLGGVLGTRQIQFVTFVTCNACTVAFVYHGPIFMMVDSWRMK